MLDDTQAIKIESETENCVLKFYKKREKRAPLFITDFINGQVNLKRSTLEFECFKSENDAETINTGANRNLLANNGRLTYTGSSETERNSQIRYFVGVRNKRTGKMKMYDSVIFQMNPVVTPIITKDAQSPKAKSYWEGLNSLTENFGSKLKKRAMNAKLKFAVTSSLDETFSLDDWQLSLSAAETSITDTQPMGYLPALNREALSVSDVFSVEDIISAEESASLEIEAAALFQSDDLAVKRNFISNYVTSRFVKGNIELDKAKYLIYYNYLVIFKNLNYNDLRKKDPTPDIPEPYKQIILNTFTTSSRTPAGRSSRTIPAQMRDKLVAYALVLALFIDDFYVNTSEVFQDFTKPALSKIVMIAQALGCHISSHKIGDQTVKFANLKLPLFKLMPKYAKKS